MTNALPRSLPARPNLEQLKKQAKELLGDYRNGDAVAVKLIEAYERHPDARTFRLQDAQRVLARSYGQNSWTSLKERVLLQAIKNGDQDNLRAILKDAADPIKLLSATFGEGGATGHAFGQGTTPLQFASFRPWAGQKTHDILIQHGAAVDLHSACGLGMLEVITDILSKSPHEVARQVDTYFPIQYAVAAGQPEAVGTLLAHGDDPNRIMQKVGWFAWEHEAIDLGKPDWRPVHMAAIWGIHPERIRVMAALLDGGADINAASPLDGYRAIHLATVPNWTHMVDFLIQQGVDVDSRSTDRHGLKLPSETQLEEPHGGYEWTPLMVACGEGFQEVAQLLLDSGADVHARNSNGLTPLHIAAGGFWPERKSVYAELVQTLLDCGADPAAVDNDGRTPRDFAARKDYQLVLERL